MSTDRYGLAITSASEAAIVSYRAGLDSLLAAWPDAETSLDRAIELDPDFALAHAARARLYMVYGHGGAARQSAARAQDLAAPVTERERRHIDVIAQSINGQPARTLEATLAHIREFPCDALIFSLTLGGSGLLARSGRLDHNEARVALCESVARYYGRDWWFLGFLGWAYTENGQLGVGRQITERSLDLRSANAHAAHAYSHALFEYGAGTDSIAFLTEWLPNYDRKGFYHGHLSWHLALIELECGNAERALEIYQSDIRPEVCRPRIQCARRQRFAALAH